ncbi:MAG: histidinol dehydrogenase [Treponema sp.]|jgi:histidinol dehydrogenase|nr:histidinol dehydrogenase [Treponema sp.]
METITGDTFDSYWKLHTSRGSRENEETEETVREIIAAVRNEGDEALIRYGKKFDRSSPLAVEIPGKIAEEAWRKLSRDEADLCASLTLSAEHIRRFSEEQRRQFRDFEYPMGEGLVTGQRVVPLSRAAIYVPAGRFPLISTALMGLVPAMTAGTGELLLVSPPLEDGMPDRRILGAAWIAGDVCNSKAILRFFAMGGAQAIAALALGTESVPRCDIIAGPGNKYVAAAKRQLYGEVGIDFVAGPTDVLIIADKKTANAETIAADMIAQAEHDADARARALVPDRKTADSISAAVEKRLSFLSAANPARASLDAGGLMVLYRDREEAIRIANTIAPEHLELQLGDPDQWIPSLVNYGSLFIGSLSAEALGDYSAGINHTLPTSGSARFTGGLSVRHFLKTLTSLRCERGRTFELARKSAETIAKAEGLEAHAQSAALRSEAFENDTLSSALSREETHGIC